MKIIRLYVAIALIGGISKTGTAQDVHLHVNPKWEECSFQIDPSLTQDDWHRFTQEAGGVIYFRPVTGAATMGRGHFELSVLQWNSGIDETADAWNNTFVHPDTAHYLIGGDVLPFPGLTLRAGLTDKMDAGIYWTARPGANYGLIGGQIQYNLLQDSLHGWDLSARLGFNSLYGPDDLGLTVCGIDLLAGKKISVITERVSVSPYALVSSSLAHAHEKTEAVVLHNENIFGAQGAIGVAAEIYFVRLGVEYNFAAVNTVSYRAGFGIKF